VLSGHLRPLRITSRAATSRRRLAMTGVNAAIGTRGTSPARRAMRRYQRHAGVAALRGNTYEEALSRSRSGGTGIGQSSGSKLERTVLDRTRPSPRRAGKFVREDARAGPSGGCIEAGLANADVVVEGEYGRRSCCHS